MNKIIKKGNLYLYRFPFYMDRRKNNGFSFTYRMCSKTRGKRFRGNRFILEIQKQNGFIFYTEDLNTLLQGDRFDLYYYETRGFIHSRNAFPIPIELYRSLKIDQWSLKWLQIFYQLYYEENSPPFWQWQYWNFMWAKISHGFIGLNSSMKRTTLLNIVVLFQFIKSSN